MSFDKDLNKLLANAKIANNSVKEIKYLISSRILLTIIILLWTILAIYFFIQEQDDKKRKDMQFAHFMSAYGISTIGVLWALTIGLILVVSIGKGVIQEGMGIYLKRLNK